MKRLYSRVVVLLLALSSAACENIVKDLNVSPDNPSNASATLLLTGAELANVTIHEGHTARVADMFSGYFTGTDRQYKDINNYNITGSSFNQTWQNIYYGVVEQTNLVVQKSQPLNNRLVSGIAKVIQVHAVGTAAACWGDVPYTQAGKSTEFPNPISISRPTCMPGYKNY